MVPRDGPRVMNGTLWGVCGKEHTSRRPGMDLRDREIPGRRNVVDPKLALLRAEWMPCALKDGDLPPLFGVTPLGGMVRQTRVLTWIPFLVRGDVSDEMTGSIARTR